MDFEWNAEQKMLKKSIRDFFKKELPSETMREILNRDSGFSETLWDKMTELGWIGLMFPEQFGGSGYGFLELAILLEEMGYFLYTGPFFSTVLLGGLPISTHGSHKLKELFLEEISEGNKRVTFAIKEAKSKGYHPSDIRLTAEKEEGSYILNGTKLFVPDAHIAEYILCAARTKEKADSKSGITVFVVDTKDAGVRITPMDTISARKQSDVVFRNVRASESHILGMPDEGWPIVEEAIRTAALGRSFEMIGGAQAALDVAVGHAKARIQFGRPIGTFQAIQHHITDMWIAVNNARMLCLKAACIQAKGGSAEKLIGMAKIKAGEALRFVSSKGHQILGAIGFSDEYDMHYYYRRAITDDLSFGDRSFQQEVVAGNLLDN